MTPQEAVNVVTQAEGYQVIRDGASVHVLTPFWAVSIDINIQQGVYHSEPAETSEWVVLSNLECNRILNDVHRREDAALN